jgi:hypothetical protein
MKGRLIESSKRLIALLKGHAEDLDRLASMSPYPKSLEYRRRAEKARSDAMNAEETLRRMDKPGLGTAT